MSPTDDLEKECEKLHKKLGALLPCQFEGCTEESDMYVIPVSKDVEKIYQLCPKHAKEVGLDVVK